MRLLKWHELLNFTRMMIKCMLWEAVITVLLSLLVDIVNADLGLTIAICATIFFFASTAFFYFADCLCSF